MAAPVTLTYATLAVDGGARRPSQTDVGGYLLEDKADSPPPQTGTHLYAALMNQVLKLEEAHGQTAHPAILTVDFDGGGVPFIDQRQTLNKALVNADFTLFDDGTGITRIQWVSTKLPTPVCRPTGLTFHGSGLHIGSVTQILNWSGAGAGASTPGTHRIIVTSVVATSSAAANVAFSFQFN